MKDWNFNELAIIYNSQTKKYSMVGLIKQEDLQRKNEKGFLTFQEAKNACSDNGYINK